MKDYDRQLSDHIREHGRNAYAWRFAQTVLRLAPSQDAASALFFAAYLTAQKTIEDKNICADISAYPDLAQQLVPPACARAESWEREASAPQEIAAQNYQPPIASRNPNAPLVLEASRLYLRANWLLENRLVQMLQARLTPPPAADSRLPAPKCKPQIANTNLAPSQLAAIEAAANSSFHIITGGPGTGKTTIISAILDALLSSPAPPRAIRLCAPTGKAAARMAEAVPTHEAAATIHRLLGYRAFDNAFKHCAANPFDADLLIIDEASMIDLPTMVALLDAAPPTCRIILIGDKHQLAAVETGSVFADICDAWMEEGNREWGMGNGDYSNTPIAPALPRGEVPTPPRANGASTSVSNRRPCGTVLSFNFRSKDAPQIIALKDLVNEGKADEAWELLANSTLHIPHPALSLDSTLHAPRSSLAGSADLRAKLAAHPLPAGFKSYAAKNISPVEALARFEEFRILCATRTDAALANEAMSAQLRIRPLAHGYPLMIAENDHANALYNGDIGICLEDPAAGRVNVHFPALDAGAGTRAFAPPQLPAHEPCFAMTVHKSQGSGFGAILLLLPEDPANPLLTRELLYTAITRARRHCEIWATESAFKAAVSRPTTRASGLREKLQRPH